jgi:hypothetical protein
MTKHQKELLREILDIALTDEVNAITVQYSGHVDGVQLYVYKGGWTEGAIPVCNRMTFGQCDDDKSTQTLTEFLEYIKAL